MSGQPNALTRYEVTLTRSHFPTGDEEYAFGVTLDDGETVVASGVVPSASWNVDPPVLDPDALTITGADDGQPAAGSTVLCYIVVAEPGIATTVAAPALP